MNRLAVIAGAALILSGCGEITGQPTEPAGSPECEITDYGNGVWFFDCSRGFGSALAAWRDSLGQVAILAVAPLDSYAYGKTRGYWVVVGR